jgi:hypothetical protein
MKQVHAIAIGNRGRGARGLQVRARVVMSTLSTVAGVAGLLAPAHTPEVGIRAKAEIHLTGDELEGRCSKRRPSAFSQNNLESCVRRTTPKAICRA